MMPLWKFLVYVDEPDANGRRRVPFRDWYGIQDVKVQASCYAAITALQGVPDWEDSDVEEFKSLIGVNIGLGEVRFEVTWQEGKKQIKRQFRCLGIWPADGNEFVLLNGLEKSGRTPIPPDAYTEAQRFRRRYGQGRGGVDELFN